MPEAVAMNMQYWKPEGEDLFAGDMMPYWDGRRFHLFYLLDHGHHSDQSGLGGHQWAHAATEDLTRWTHFPLALPIGASGSVDQHGICTGSIFAHGGLFHAFYATRIRQADRSVHEVICRAVSSDLIHFDKSPGNPMFGAPQGFDPAHHRDPHVFQDPATSRFHMLVTARRRGRTGDRSEDRGVLAHYLSTDLNTWTLTEDMVTMSDSECPECPEHFEWNGRWYLLFSHCARMEYRIGQGPLGPWQTASRASLEPESLAVPRTAAFGADRRIAVGFLNWRAGERDIGHRVYAGSTVFREVFQSADGTLTSAFPAEQMPPAAAESKLGEPQSLCSAGEYRFQSVSSVPASCLLTVTVSGEAEEFGLLVRADKELASGYQIAIRPGDGTVAIRPWPADPASQVGVTLSDVEGLQVPITLQVAMTENVIDLCINRERTLIERCFDFRGTHVALGVLAGRANWLGGSSAPLRA